MVKYKSGDLIAKSKPFVFGLETRFSKEYCHHCFRKCDSESLQRCSQCTFAYYCNRECQKLAWQLHKHECKNLKRICPHVPHLAVRLIALLIYKLKTPQGKESEEIFGVNRTFDVLESHESDISKHESRAKEIFSVINELKNMLGDNDLPPPKNLITIFSKFVINSYSIHDWELNAIGAGLYLGASIFDHSCDPNAVAIFEGTTLYVRALKDIKNGSKDSIFLSYIDVLTATSERRKTLSEQYYFVCNCSRCTDTTMPSLEEQRELDVPQEIYGKVSEQSRKVILSLNEKKLSMEPSDILAESLKCLCAHKGVLSKENLLNLQLLEFVFNACIDLSDWEGSASYGYELFQLYKLYNHDPPSIAVHLFKLGKILHLLEQVNEAEELLLEAAAILKKFYGDEHVIYKEIRKLIYECQAEISANRLSKNVIQ